MYQAEFRHCSTKANQDTSNGLSEIEKTEKKFLRTVLRHRKVSANECSFYLRCMKSLTKPLDHDEEKMNGIIWAP